MLSGFRFTVGQLMCVIGLSALLTANFVFSSQGNFTFYKWTYAVIGCTELGVLLYNRRLSGWIWALIAGNAVPLLLMTIMELLSPPITITFAAIQMSLGMVCSLLTVLGFAMTFRDIRRRLAIYENA